jgi:SEFIR domain
MIPESPSDAPAPTVFLSYAHDSEAHNDQVLAFATFLRSMGIKAVLDTWATNSRQDWYAWMIKHITEADYVIVVASPMYRWTGDGIDPQARHRGVQSEAALMRELVYGDRAGRLPTILPVLLPGHGIDEIPLFLQPHTATRFEVSAFTESGAEELLRVVLRRPRHVEPPVATHRPELAPESGAGQTPEQAASAAGPTAHHGLVTNQINGSVHGKVLQVDKIVGNVHV